LKWDTVIEQKALELSRFLTGKSPSINFSEPAPILARQDNQEIRERVLSLSQGEAKELGIGKSELHYLRRKASTGQSFRLYQKVMEKINRIKENHESQM
jgi:CRISPR-associated protein Cas1